MYLLQAQYECLLQAHHVYVLQAHYAHILQASYVHLLQAHYACMLQAHHVYMLQAHHVGKIFLIAQDTLHELQPATAVAAVKSAEALRQVLEAQERLSSHPSEATLKQVIAVLKEVAPDLQQACWLLVSQHQELKSQVRVHESDSPSAYH